MDQPTNRSNSVQPISNEHPQQCRQFVYHLIHQADFLWSQKKLLAAIIGSAGVALVIIALVATPLYQAKATLFITEDRPSISTAVMNSKLGRLATGLLGTMPASSRTMNTLFAILRSQTVTDFVVENTNVLKAMYPDKYDKNGTLKQGETTPAKQDIRRRLSQIVTIGRARHDVLAVAVRLPDPKIAPELANAYLDALHHFLDEDELSFATRNRAFIGEQLVVAEKELTAANAAVAKFQEQHKFYSIETQTKLALETAANLEAQVMDAEYNMKRTAALRSTQSAQYRQLVIERQAFRSQLKELYASSGLKVDPQGEVTFVASDNAIKSLTDLPYLTQHYSRLQLNLLVQEKVFEFLKEQYEIAKIQEASVGYSFSVLDRAQVPQKRSWPKRKLMVITGTMASTIFALFVVYGLRYRREMLATQDSSERVAV